MLAMTQLPIERLVEFIVARRKAIGLTQRGLAQASGINPGTLANIEAGRVTKSPALGTLEQLARGLRIPAEELIAVARGEQPGGAPQVQPPKLSLLDGLQGGRYPLTEKEQAFIAKLEAAGVWFTLPPNYLDFKPSERRTLWRDLTNAAKELAAMQGVEMEDGA